MKWNSTLGAVAMTVVLTACTAQYKNHGYVPLQRDLDGLIIGVDLRDSVIDSIGAPTFGGLVQDGNVYYVRSRFEHFGALAPKEIDRQVVALTFDPDGVLQNIERYGLQDGRVVLLDYRVTETSIADQSLIRRLISSIGGPSADQFID